MALRESDTVELKREVTKRFCREVVAFANTHGGTILVGVDDDGTVVGVDDPDAVMRQVTSMVENDVCPEALELVTVGRELVDGCEVVRVDVEEGDRKPYCIAQKGFVPAGVYIRVGSSSLHAGVERIRAMIRESDGDVYEERRCLRQGLTFSCAQELFAKAGVAFGDEQRRTLGLVARDGRHTNLALLLSDQNPFSVKCATFDDASGTSLKNRREFGGSLLGQIHDVLEYLDLSNRLVNAFNAHVRKDARDYPPIALREALVNCMAHRSYEYASPVCVRLYPDRAEFVSVGGVVEGFELEDLEHGVSVARNPRLVAVLYRLGLMEAYGVGMQTIMASYVSDMNQPVFDASHNAFVTILPNRNYGAPLSYPAGVGAHAARRVPVETRCEVTTGITDRPTALMGFAQAHGTFSRAEASAFLGTGRDATLAELNRLVRAGRLVKTGSTKAVRYALPGTVASSSSR